MTARQVALDQLRERLTENRRELDGLARSVRRNSLCLLLLNAAAAIIYAVITAAHLADGVLYMPTAVATVVFLALTAWSVLDHRQDGRA